MDVFEDHSVTNNVLPYATTAAQTSYGTLGEDYEWQHVSMEINNVTAKSRIGIGPKLADRSASGYHRMYIDNIRITVKSY